MGGNAATMLWLFFTLVMAAVAGVVPADCAFTGFSHTAVITVATVLIISHARLKKPVLRVSLQPT